MDKNHSGETFKFIISSQYFLYFGVLGIFLPYFNLYCYHLGFDGFQIGTLSALKSAVVILFSLMWGGLADHFQIRRPIYILCNFASAGICAFYLLTTDFYLMLVITLCSAIFSGPIISFLEAFTMDGLGKEKRDYGKIRVWGSVSFIACSVIFGKMTDLFSPEIILIPIFAGSLTLAVFALGIPRVTVSRKTPFFSSAKLLLKKRVVCFLICAFLMLMSHGAYYGFFSIHLENLGHKSMFIGIAWALATLSEILVMVNSDKIFGRFSLESILLFSLAMAALRWFVLFLSSSPVIILISQLSHAFTYGTFHIASILYIDLLTPAQAKTTGQTVNNAVTYGLGMMVGFFMNGYLYEHMDSSGGLFMVSALIALAGCLMLLVSKIGD